METQCYKLGVDVRLNTEATEKTIKGDYDKVILAAGSTPVIPGIKGIEHAVVASDYLTHKVNVGRKVVVIGAGLAGTEAAADIAPDADEVTLIEMLPDILAAANHCLNNDQHLRRLVKDRGVQCIAGAKVTEILPDQVTFEKDGEVHSVSCDTVINAVGFRSNNQLTDYLEEKYEDVAVIGDAVRPRKILDAVHEGYHAIRIMGEVEVF